MKKLIIITFLSFLILGCEDKRNIDAVKNIIPEVNRTNTIGNLLDNRDICEKVVWSQYIDSENKPVVKYQCFLRLELTFDRYNNENTKQEKIKSINNSIKNSLERMNIYKTRKSKRQETINYLTSLYEKFKNSPDIIKIRNSGRTLIQLCHELSNHYICDKNINIARLYNSDSSDAKEYVDAINNLIRESKAHALNNVDYLTKAREWDLRWADPTVNYSDDTTTDIFVELFNKMTEPSYSESEILEIIKDNYNYTHIDKKISEIEASINAIPQRIKSIESVRYLDYIETVKWSTINIHAPVMFQHTLCVTKEEDNIKESRTTNVFNSRELYNTNGVSGEYLKTPTLYSSISTPVISCLDY